MSTQNEASSSTDAVPYSFTLQDIKASTWGDHELADIAFKMKNSGFHHWWFVIYRTSYNDEAAWQRYLKVIKHAAYRSLLDLGGDVLLEQYMEWTVVSDKATLDGASKADVRRRFQSWCEERSEERDGPGATKPKVKRLPRFNYCLYVDAKCLETLARIPANYYEPVRRWKRPKSKVVAVVLDGRFNERSTGSVSGQGLHPNIEGCTEWYVGWRYEVIEMLVDTYNELHTYSLSDQGYQRPPLIGPHGFDSMLT